MLPEGLLAVQRRSFLRRHKLYVETPVAEIGSRTLIIRLQQRAAA